MSSASGSELAFALIAATALCGCGTVDRPNIILITLDTTRADHLSCYGYAVRTTPQLDEIARTGTRFASAIAQSATTPVSCASQLTGRYPYQHGLRSMHDRRLNRLREDVPMIQEELSRLGYSTAAFVSAFPATSTYGFSRGFDVFDEVFLEQGRRAEIAPDGRVFTGESQRTAAETTDRVLPWLRQQARGDFFAWIHYFDPHDISLLPPESLVTGFLRASVTEDHDEFLRSIYDAEIFFIDQQIGRIVAELERLGIRNETALVITADHGEGLGDHDWWGHGILYQEQIRAPLILNGPGIPEGRVIEDAVEHVDLFPTLLQLAAPERPAGETGAEGGRSLLGLLSGTRPPGGRVAYSEVHNILALDPSPEQRKRGEMYSLIQDGMKLIHVPRDSSLDQLYDLRNDPTEQRNLLATRPEVAAGLLEQLRRRQAIATTDVDPSTVDPQELEQLRSLGYVR